MNPPNSTFRSFFALRFCPVAVGVPLGSICWKDVVDSWKYFAQVFGPFVKFLWKLMERYE